MYQLLSINLFIIILINIIGIGLAFWVWSANKKERVNQLTVLWTIPILLMINFGYLSDIFPQYDLILRKFRFGAVALFFIAGYFFCQYFPRGQKRSRIIDNVYTLIWFSLFYLSVFTPAIIEDINPTEFGIDVVFGKGILVYYLMTIFSVFVFLYILFKKYLNISKEEKLKAQYFLIGVVLFALFNLIFNVIFPIFRGTMQYYQFGDYSAIFLLGFTAYAIVKRELFGIKVVLTSFLVGMMGIILAIFAFVGPSLSGYTLRFLSFFIFFLFLIFGYFLIESVLREVKQKEILEKRVKKRTKELEKAKDVAEERAKEIEKRKEELEKVLKAVVGRELKMIELKEKIKELEERKDKS